ncbi:hypothetical protein I5907_12465 [Panacibacter sp. DH6]|uniref:Uncharacterized protein n=1 Tax=Panacibacter microcysteis TaxID=2793269 RepID=A0A931GW12_9BACT|nr:hypothetical protein [Panacibacter microcysteis]MBG9377050.1 hypothetical protein [Panacibacter microcysteis]
MIQRKLDRLNALGGEMGYKSTLDVYIKDGKYSEEQINIFKQKAADYIKDNNLSVDVNVEKVK